MVRESELPSDGTQTENVKRQVLFSNSDAAERGTPEDRGMENIYGTVKVSERVLSSQISARRANAITRNRVLYKPGGREGEGEAGLFLETIDTRPLLSCLPPSLPPSHRLV